jgi:Queuosine salvage protein
MAKTTLAPCEDGPGAPLGAAHDGACEPARALRQTPAALSLTDDIRAAAARVAGAARHVRIRDEAIEGYARTIPSVAPPPPDLEGADDETRAAFSLQLNAINFGSGWFPTLRKKPAMSGFRTIEAGLRARGPWTAAELRAITREDIAAVMGQDAEHELMGLYAEHLRELGDRVDSFYELARAGEGSAERLATILAGLDGWRDVSRYDGAEVPLFKRAQIAAADLALAGIAPADDLHRLTLFADNLVPHVLRLDGVLDFEPALVARIEAEELLEHDSPEEIEIRACALHAVELLVAAHGNATATVVDNVLWHRGGEPRYKARPRHRARCTQY